MFTEQSFSPHTFGQITDKTHEEHQKLYAGYVKHANLIMEHSTEFAKEGIKYVYEIGELQRRFSFEWGGIKNHEVYFSLLSGTQAPNQESALYQKIITNWDSIDNFIERMTMVALTRGIGWAMLYYDRATDMILLGWIDEQHLGQLAGCDIIIALDMWEHSYVADYQPSGKKQYIIDFFMNMNWSVAEANFAIAQSIH